VLAFARGVEGERMILQPKHLLEEMRKIASETFAKSIEIRTEVAKGLWDITGDPTQIHQVVLNLCVNARDAMPNGGILKMEADNMHLDEHYARMHPDAKAGDYVVIHISDTGTGISPHVLQKMFEPFFTTKEFGKGTGLGLSTVLAIVKSHGGFISVYSEIGKGTIFKLYFPAQINSASAELVVKPENLPAGNGEVILVIDDEASIREITKETLETFGYRVITANDGVEGVAVYAQKKNSIDAVLTDMMMPLMNGEVTIRALQKINPQVKIIASSGFAGNGTNIETAQNGAHDFLTKPFTAEKLLRSLEAILRKP